MRSHTGSSVRVISIVSGNWVDAGLIRKRDLSGSGCGKDPLPHASLEGSGQWETLWGHCPVTTCVPPVTPAFLPGICIWSAPILKPCYYHRGPCKAIGFCIRCLYGWSCVLQWCCTEWHHVLIAHPFTSSAECTGSLYAWSLCHPYLLCLTTVALETHMACRH